MLKADWNNIIFFLNPVFLQSLFIHVLSTLPIIQRSCVVGGCYDVCNTTSKASLNRASCYGSSPSCIDPGLFMEIKCWFSSHERRLWSSQISVRGSKGPQPHMLRVYICRQIHSLFWICNSSDLKLLLYFDLYRYICSLSRLFTP